MPPPLAGAIADAVRHLPSTRAAVGDHGDLTGPREAIRELLAVALDESGERASRAATALLRGDGTADELRAALSEAGALLDLLEAL